MMQSEMINTSLNSSWLVYRRSSCTDIALIDCVETLNIRFWNLDTKQRGHLCRGPCQQRLA